MEITDVKTVLLIDMVTFKYYFRLFVMNTKKNKGIKKGIHKNM